MVFYGSQTGTAEEFAGRLAKEGMRYKLKGMVADPEECDMVSALWSDFLMMTPISLVMMIMHIAVITLALI